MLLPWMLVAYILGSIPFGWIVSKLVKGIDIREFGSGNIGATNVFRTVGKKWGIVVLVLDIFKGYLAVSAPALLFLYHPPIPARIVLGTTAILAHSFPVWLKFKGGKGVATSLGVFLAITPIATELAFALWLIVFLIFRIISVASLVSAVSFPLIIYVFQGKQEDSVWLLTISLLLAVFIFYTHRQNIRRILQGEEKPLF